MSADYPQSAIRLHLGQGRVRPFVVDGETEADYGAALVNALGTQTESAKTILLDAYTFDCGDSELDDTHRVYGVGASATRIKSSKSKAELVDFAARCFKLTIEASDGEIVRELEPNDDGDFIVDLHLDSVTYADVLALTGPSGRVAACLEDGTFRVLDGETPGGIPLGTHSASVMLIPHPKTGKPPKAYFVQEPVGTGTHSAGSGSGTVGWNDREAAVGKALLQAVSEVETIDSNGERPTIILFESAAIEDPITKAGVIYVIKEGVHLWPTWGGGLSSDPLFQFINPPFVDEFTTIYNHGSFAGAAIATGVYFQSGSRYLDLYGTGHYNRVVQVGGTVSLLGGGGLYSGSAGTGSATLYIGPNSDFSISQTGVSVHYIKLYGTGVPLGSGVSGVLPSANGGAGTVNGIVKANGSGTTSAAVAGTDYLAPNVRALVMSYRPTPEVDGRYYTVPEFSGLQTNQSFPANVWHAIAVPIHTANWAANEIALQVQTGQSGKNLRFAIWDTVSDTDLMPGDLIWESSDISVTSAGVKTATVTEPLSDLVWIAFNHDGDTDLNVRSFVASPFMGALLGYPSAPYSNGIVACRITGSYGAAPSTAGTPTVTAAVIPAITLRKN